MRLQDDIDFTTLTWVKGELDETLKQARHALEAFVEDPTDVSQMRFCATYLHQVQGTLRMVELYGAAMVTEEMERLASMLTGEQVGDRDEAYTVLMRGIVQLPDYLERLQSGHKDIPIVLLPLLNDLRASRGEKPLPESVLFSPDLSRALPTSAKGPAAAMDDAGLHKQAEMLRMQFQLSLLKWFRNEEPATHVAKLAAVCDRLVSIVAQEDARRLFWVSAGLLNALRENAFAPQPPLKQAIGKVEREIKRLVDSGESAFRLDPPRELTRNLLYFAAHAPTQHGRIAELRQTFDLEKLLPTEDELRHAQGSISGHNRALLDTVSAAIKEDLLRVKDALDLFMRTQSSDVGALSVQGEVLARVADTLGMLGLGVPRGVVLEQKQALQEVSAGQRKADEATLLDIAGALLYVESSLDDQVAHLGGAGGTRDASHADSRKVLDALIKEAQSNFAQAKQCFVAFVESNWDHAQLQDVPRLLDEVGGALRILELDEPPRYLSAIGRFTETELLSRHRVPNGQQLDTLADALASLEYYLEALREHRAGREKILDVARQRLEALGYWPIPEAGVESVLDSVPTAAALSAISENMAPVAAFEIAAPEPVASSAEPAPQPVLAALPDDLGSASTAPEPSPAAPAPDQPIAAAAVAAAEPVAELAEPVVAEQTLGFELASDEIDEEIREVFIEEVQEEIDNLRALFPIWRTNPESPEQLKPIRRVFHTLKGSGRLVGAMTLGEFSWKIENMLNRVLDQTVRPDAGVIEVIAVSQQALPDLLDALKGQGRIRTNLEGIKRIADRISSGDLVSAAQVREAASLAPPAVAAPPAVVDAAPIEAPVAAEPTLAEPVALEIAETVAVAPDPALAELDTELAAEPIDAAAVEAALAAELAALAAQHAETEAPAAEPAEAAFAPDEAVEVTLADEPALTELANASELVEEPSPVVAVVADHADSPAPTAAGVEAMRAHSTAFSIDSVLFDILKAEVAGHLETVDAYLTLAAHRPQPVSDALLRAVHTMSGAFAMTEVPHITEVVGPLEAYIKRSIAHRLTPTQEGIDLIAAAADAIRQLMLALEAEPSFAPQFTSLAERLLALRDTVPETTGPLLPMHMEVEHDIEPETASVVDSAGTITAVHEAMPEATSAEFSVDPSELERALAAVPVASPEFDPELQAALADLPPSVLRAADTAVDEPMASAFSVDAFTVDTAAPEDEFAAELAILGASAEPESSFDADVQAVAPALASADEFTLSGVDEPVAAPTSELADADIIESEAEEISTLELDAAAELDAPVTVDIDAAVEAIEPEAIELEVAPIEAIELGTVAFETAAPEPIALETIELGASELEAVDALPDTGVADAYETLELSSEMATESLELEATPDLAVDQGALDASVPALPAADIGVAVDSIALQEVDDISELALLAEPESGGPSAPRAAPDQDLSLDEDSYENQFEELSLDSLAGDEELASAEDFELIENEFEGELIEAESTANVDAPASPAAAPLADEEHDHEAASLVALLLSEQAEVAPAVADDVAAAADEINSAEAPAIPAEAIEVSEVADGLALEQAEWTADAVAAADSSVAMDSVIESIEVASIEAEPVEAETVEAESLAADAVQPALADAELDDSAELPLLDAEPVEAQDVEIEDVEIEALSEDELAPEEAGYETTLIETAPIEAALDSESADVASVDDVAEPALIAETAMESPADAVIEAGDQPAPLAADGSSDTDSVAEVAPETAPEMEAQPDQQVVDVTPTPGALPEFQAEPDFTAEIEAEVEAELEADLQAALADEAPAPISAPAAVPVVAPLTSAAPASKGPGLAALLSGADPDPDEPLRLPDMDEELLDIFLEEGVDILDHSDGLLAKLRDNPSEREIVVGLQRDLHTLKGGARMAGIMPIGDLGHAAESLLEAVADGRRELGNIGLEVLERVFDRLHGMVTRIGERRALAMPHTLLGLVEALARGEALALPVQKDIVVEDIAAADTAPAAVASPVTSEAPKPVTAVAERAAAAAAKPTAMDAGDDDDSAVRAPQEQIRIRADLLDRLVNYAGEVAIYRARLEQQIGAFRGGLVEMEATTSRLREQLRRLEIETEAQIIARYQREGDDPSQQNFDPLELDRFSTLQQLSRALSESAADLTNLQGTLEDLTRQYETLLLQQSRVSSELQEGLMRTRMVPFDALVPRLRRILRQTASELGKKAQLKVEGAQGEMDRNVLDRMTAPLEHMLRNALAHGLEMPADREAAGKPGEGTVRIHVSREASEVVIRVSDDGRGIDRDAIRRKAIERGLMDADAQLSDRDLYGFILESGFSTAQTVSKIAGRGVGMDVVHSEIKQLGGSLYIESQFGKGSEFVIRLPFTLAVTQAVFVKLGETHFAIPITSVQGVARIAPVDLETQLASGEPHFEYAGERYAIYDMGHLLGHGQVKAAESLQVPLLLARSGDLRAAICVDQVIGSKEIVVKPTGPQINSIPGIFGATVMGDGSVVVILDVAPLVRRAAALRQSGDAPREAEIIEQRAIPLVMVVDDSITMRKVSSRVLERAGYEVITAKDGVDAIEKMQERVPNAMLLDIEMPRMDGYELATHMRNDARLRGVPIIMITSRTGEKHRQRAFEIGVDRYLGKPYQEPELMRNVHEVLKVGRGGAA